MKKIELTELRIEIDQINERIISGLKERSRYPLNEGIFEKEFAEGKTWFLYRLKREQDIDAQYGRYNYLDQMPFFFKKNELEKPIDHRTSPIIIGLSATHIDKSNEILASYREILKKICKKSDEADTYGETTKIDVGNVLAINERVIGVGKQVAEYKILSDYSITKEKSVEKIKSKLIDLEREKDVLSKINKTAKNYGLSNPKVVTAFMKKVIDITTDAEVEYILQKRKSDM